MLCSLLYGCGFQLRGLEQWQIAEELQQLNLRHETDISTELKRELKRQLTGNANIDLSDADHIARLVIHRDKEQSRVLAVDSAGKVSEYLLQYEVDFSLYDKDHNILIDRRTIKLQRDYRFDPNNVLAKEYERNRLYASMVEDAVRQLIRQLASVSSGKN